MGTSQSPRAGSGLHGPTLADVGELDLLDMLRPYLAEADRSLLIAPGDDAAAWEAPEDRVVVVTTDTLAQDVHFRDPRDEDAADALGWRLLAVSLSDLAAMGAEPGPAFLALALPEHWPVAHLLALYRGLSACATAHGASLAGGNLSAAAVAVLTSTCLGAADPARLLRRGGAMAGWPLAVTGRLGGAAAALRVMEASGVGQGVEAAWKDRIYRPQPRLAAGRALAAAGVPVCLDVSDGLFIDAARLLADAEAAGLVIEAELIPVEAGIEESWPDGWLDVSGGGEDYELLFAAPPDRIEAACASIRATGLEATVIGRFDEVAGLRLRDAGVERPPRATGHRHFG